MPSQRHSATAATWAHGSRSGCYGSDESLPHLPRSRSSSHDDDDAPSSMAPSLRPHSSRSLQSGRGDSRVHGSVQTPGGSMRGETVRSQLQAQPRSIEEEEQELEPERRSLGRSLQRGRGDSRVHGSVQTPGHGDSRVHGSVQTPGGSMRGETARSQLQAQSRSIEEEDMELEPERRSLGRSLQSGRGDSRVHGSVQNPGGSMRGETLRSQRQAQPGSIEEEEQELEPERRSLGRSLQSRGDGGVASRLSAPLGSHEAADAEQRHASHHRSVRQASSKSVRVGEGDCDDSLDACSEVTEMTDHDRTPGSCSSPQQVQSRWVDGSRRSEGSPTLLGAQAPCAGKLQKAAASFDSKGRATVGSRLSAQADDFTEEQTEGGTWRAPAEAAMKCIALDKRDVAGVKALVWKFGLSGAWIRRVNPEAPQGLGLARGDRLMAVNGRSVADLPRSAIEAVWSQGQKEGRYLHLELSPAEPGCLSPWENREN